MSDTRLSWPRIVAGLVVGYVALEATARATKSFLGEDGVLVAAVVLGALFAAERFLFKTPWREAAHKLGLGAPARAGLARALAICALLVLVIPIAARLAGGELRAVPGWLALLPGLFAQGGIAEETLFRGWLFRHVRQAHPFARAAWLSMIPFVIVHLWLFATMPWAVALAALLLAVVSSFPLAWLFERGGNTMWAPALLHFVIQAGAKVVVAEGAAQTYAIVWMAACAVLPFLAFWPGSRARVPREARGYGTP